MAQERVAFLPWTEAEAGAFIKQYTRNTRNRAYGHHMRKWTVHTMDTPGTPLARIGFGMGQRLHVWGHGAINDPIIESDVGGVEIDAEEVVNRLVEKGLKKQYLGTVVADSCYSALGDMPFAKRLARALWQRGFKATCVLGYKGSLQVQMSWFKSPRSDYMHRKVEVEDGDGGTKMIKSSAAQERFYGWT